LANQVEDLKRQNELLQEQIRQVEAALLRQQQQKGL
jgi:hypothetical protein